MLSDEVSGLRARNLINLLLLTPSRLTRGSFRIEIFGDTHVPVGSVPVAEFSPSLHQVRSLPSVLRKKVRAAEHVTLFGS